MLRPQFRSALPFNMSQALWRHARALSLFAALSALTFPAQADVGVYGADDPSYLTNVVSTIQTTSAGNLGNVVGHRLCRPESLCEATPTLAQLQAYTAVLVYSNAEFADPVALGNVLADYVDAGGTVALASFGLYLPTTAMGIGGRLSAGGYLPVIQGPSDIDSVQSLVPVIATHPLLQGVISFNGGSGSFRNVVSLASGATLVATWNNAGNTPLIATKGRVVALNFYPASSAVRDDFWDASTDGGRILVNALAWPLSINAVTLTAGQVGNVYPSTSLSASSGTSPFTWTATGLPAGLSLSSAGVLTGTPTVHGSFSVAVTVTDNSATPLTRTVTLPLTIAPAALALITTSLAPATVGQPYTMQLSPAGGVAPYTWSATGLPAGLSIDGNGLISGTPTDTKLAQAKAALNVTVTLTDSLKVQATQTLSLTVNAAPSTAVTPVPALNEWTLALLALCVAAFGWRARHNRA